MKQYRKGDVVKILPCRQTGGREEYGQVSRSEFKAKGDGNMTMVRIVGHKKPLPAFLVARHY